MERKSGGIKGRYPPLHWFKKRKEKQGKIICLLTVFPKSHPTHQDHWLCWFSKLLREQCQCLWNTGYTQSSECFLACVRIGSSPNSQWSTWSPGHDNMGWDHHDPHDDQVTRTGGEEVKGRGEKNTMVWMLPNDCPHWHSHSGSTPGLVVQPGNSNLNHIWKVIILSKEENSPETTLGNVKIGSNC